MLEAADSDYQAFINGSIINTIKEPYSVYIYCDQEEYVVV